MTYRKMWKAPFYSIGPKALIAFKLTFLGKRQPHGVGSVTTVVSIGEDTAKTD
jgi:hypothetical protein